MVNNKRLIWIDWMKAIGIYLIVYGHLMFGNHYVYTFNVPLFFIISGFLFKYETDNLIFWKKLWYNLVIPMLLICSINLGIDSAIDFSKGVFDFSSLYKFPIKFVLGFQAGGGERVVVCLHSDRLKDSIPVHSSQNLFSNHIIYNFYHY